MNKLENFDKYLISSNLQKSIRLGLFDVAKESVDVFWENDNKYLIFRLGTILLEDIGIANTELVTKYLQTELKYKNIENNGSKEYVLDIVKKACESKKDRTSCDLGYLCNFYNYEEIKDNPNIRDSLKLWEKLGFKKFKNSNYEPTDEDNINDFTKSLISSNVPQEIIDLTLLGYKYSSENIFLGIPFSYLNKKMYNDEKNIFYDKSIEVNNEYDLIFDKKHNINIVSTALDFHTFASYELSKNLINKKEVINLFNKYKIYDFQNKKELLKHILFRIEGHNVNKRIYFPFAVSIMRETEQNILTKKFNIIENKICFSEFATALQNEKENILNIRKKIILNNQFKNKY